MEVAACVYRYDPMSARHQACNVSCMMVIVDFRVVSVCHPFSTPLYRVSELYLTSCMVSVTHPTVFSDRLLKRRVLARVGKAIAGSVGIAANVYADIGA